VDVAVEPVEAVHGSQELVAVTEIGDRLAVMAPDDVGYRSRCMASGDWGRCKSVSGHDARANSSGVGLRDVRRYAGNPTKALPCTSV
jgi:hypothetical protein